MKSYDKQEIRQEITIEDIFDLLTEWGGEPEYTGFGILSSTICHNPPGEGSRKLYYYENSGLFKCYTDCDSSFDIFELLIKVAAIQSSMNVDLNYAVRFLAHRFGLEVSEIEDEDITLLDWQYLKNYEKIKNLDITQAAITSLKTYNNNIADIYCDPHCHIQPWIDEGIGESVLHAAHIGYCYATDQITIPHYNLYGQLVGLRGRTMCKEEAERFGKYRPLYINHEQFNHSLGMNLYNLNNSKNNIAEFGKAIVFESEKSCLLYQTHFGFESDISVACCGSSISSFQMKMLIDADAKEVIVAFDRQFQEIGDAEFKRLTTKLINLDKKYGKELTISFIFDKNMITSYKASPIDEGKEKFLQLFKERIFLK